MRVLWKLFLVIALTLPFGFCTSIRAQSLPSGWSDGDIGSVGLAGSATYANGTYTVSGAGSGISGTSDGFHFAYQPLSGDGTIVARVVSVQGGTYPQAGVMIRETLAANSTYAYMDYQKANLACYFLYRTTTGGSSASAPSSGLSLPYWVKVARVGSAFSSFISMDGVNWVQVGTTQTITMAQNVYVGLGVTSGSTSALATATFDSVSVNSAASPAPVISGVSSTTASVGSQVFIKGSNF